MRTRSFIAICGLLLAFFAVGGGVYAYDSGREDLIAEGVRIGGVDVGGMRVGAARERLEARLLMPLRQPVVAKGAGETFSLTSREAGIEVDIDSSVGQAVERSRRGNLLARTMRGLRGDMVVAEFPVDVTYDEKAVDRLVARAEDAIEQRATDAKVSFKGGTVEQRASKPGKAVLANRLRRDLVNAITAVRSDRKVRVRTRTVKPKITMRKLAARYPAVLIVNRDAFRLTLYKNLKPVKTYRIAVGQAGLDTPAGAYKIENKAENPAWHVPDSDWAGDLAGEIIPPDDPRNPIEARWMAIYNGAGIHGTEAVASLGTRASHGCIRMAIPDVIELYDQVPVASPVYIL